MTIMKIVLGVVAVVKATMTVQLAVGVTELALSLLKQRMMTMNNQSWPFPPATGAVPWTAKQIKAYNQAQRAQLPESPM